MISKQNMLARTNKQSPIIIYTPKNNVSLRLFLFHHAGGSHHLYRNWEQAFPSNWEVCFIEYPGRGRLADEPLFDNLSELITYLLPYFADYLHLPMAFFGHSMGARVAYSMVSQMSSQQLPLPIWLGLSSCGASVDYRTHSNNKYLLPDEQLIEEMWKMGGTPQAILQTKELWPHILRITRADLKITEDNLQIVPDNKLAISVSAFGSTDDHTVSVESLLNWQHCTKERFIAHIYQGGHFYLSKHKAELTIDIQHDIAKMKLCNPHNNWRF